MGKDNQDYFKRAGRSGGPAGPLRLFREQLGKQQAELARGGERGFPRPPPAPVAPPPPSPEVSRGPVEPREPGEWKGVPNGRTEMEAQPAAREANGLAPPEPGEESLGQEASEDRGFGPPASEEYVGPLPAPVARVVRRFPRSFRTLAWLTKGPARRFASLADRIERTLEAGRP